MFLIPYIICDIKAVQINSYGGTAILEINENTPVPTPQKGQVLVENHAASINPIDWKIRAGYLKEMMPLKFPVTLGGDFAGVVTKVGEGGENDQERDRGLIIITIKQVDEGNFTTCLYLI